MTYDEIRANLGGLLHGGDADDLSEVELMFERSANTLLAKIDPMETIRTAALSNVVHDDVFNYALPSDFKSLIDIYPQDNRDSNDKAIRISAAPFDLQKMIKDKKVSIEGSEGSKILRINWRSRQGKVLNTMNTYNGNGTWIAVGSATSIATDTIFKVSGSGSVKFNLVATGDGISNIGMTAVDLTDEDEVADVFVWVYLPSVPTSLTARWGNDITTKYWTAVAQTTQSDGTDFRVGWNLIKFPWSTATETGTVAPATIDSFKLTVANSTAISGIRVDNIIFSIGRNFDIKYYSKYLAQNSSGTWISRTSDDTDVCTLDSDAIQIYHLENLIAAAQQQESGAVDITWAKQELNGNPLSTDKNERMGLYAKYRAKYPSMAKRVVSNYGGLPARGRW